MKSSAYPSYKPSGLWWLDKMPTHWNAAALRWMSRRYSGGTPDKSNDAYWEEGEIPWLNSGAVNDGYITEPSALITQEGFSNSSTKWIPKGALVMALAGQGKTKGMVAQLGFQSTCNQSMAAIIPDHRLESRYLYWWLAANYQNIRNMAGGEARDGLNLDMLGSIQCPLPSVIEQQTIADFLDAQTAKIDTLLAKKRQFIAKLKEKRSALIARTVTRGLPPAAAKSAGLEPHPAMKDSGVEWLGSIPAHWEVKPLKHVANRSEVKVEADEDNPLPYIGLEHVESWTGRLLPLDEELVPTGISNYFKGGDTLFGKLRPYLAKACNVDFDGLCSSELLVLRGKDYAPQFLLYQLLSDGFINLVDSSTYGSKMPRAGWDFIGSCELPTPPLEEQQAIAAYLDRETARIDQLAAKVEAAITLLTEYRQALITAAVTGKIDVRNNARFKEVA